MPEAALRQEPAAAGHQRAGSPGGTSAPEQGPQPDGQLYPASGMPHSAGLAVDLLPDGYRTLSVSHGKGMQTCLDCKAAPCRSIGADAFSGVEFVRKPYPFAGACGILQERGTRKRTSVEEVRMSERERIMNVALLWGGCFCLTAAFCLSMGNDHNREKRNWLLWMELSAAALLCCDAAAWFVQGTPG